MALPPGTRNISHNHSPWDLPRKLAETAYKCLKGGFKVLPKWYFRITTTDIYIYKKHTKLKTSWERENRKEVLLFVTSV